MEHKDMREHQIINEVGAWAERQPWAPNHAPELGIVEEIGEACHAELKHFQNIRGMDDVNKFHDAITDAWGDIIIFLCHWCFLHNAIFQFATLQKTNPEFAQKGFDSIMQHLLQAASALFSPATDDPAIASQIAQRILQGVNYWACKYDYDLAVIVESTWLMVKERDWKNAPIH